ncbi:hypothetical protein IFR05_010643, partial [Cadophora sp. M221]
MPQIQASRALRAAKCLSNSSSTTVLSTSRIAPTTARSRAFSSTQAVKAADHAHEDHYDPPTGWLFGVKPGEK